MANKKISDLPEALSTDGFYVLGVKEDNGSLISAKYDLGALGDSLLGSLESVQGENDIQEFSDTTTYYPGQFTKYQGEIYKFTEIHYPGAWINADVTKSSVFTELSNMSNGGGDFEEIHFQIIALDGTGTPIEDSDIVKRRVITITMQDGSGPFTISTGNDGKATYSVLKGKKYSATIASQSGYSVPIQYTGIEASLNTRYLNFIYQAPLSGTGTLTVTAHTPAGVSIGDLDSKTISIFRNGSSDYYTATLDTTTYQAVFQNLPLGTTWVVNGNATGYTSNSYSVYLNDSQIAADIYYRKAISGNCIYVVDSNFNEISIDSALKDGEDTFKDEYSGRTWIALHVATSSSNTGNDVASRGYDYYVKLADLFTSPGDKAWCTGSKTLPHVSTTATEMNGKLMTYWMARDARDTSVGNGTARISTAAEWVLTQTLVYKPGTAEEQTLIGFMGTRGQMNPLYTNVDQIYRILRAAGYEKPAGTPVPKTASGTYYNRATWSSSQGSAANGWLWHGADHGWGNHTKTNGLGVLPLFAL